MITVTLDLPLSLTEQLVQRQIAEEKVKPCGYTDQRHQSLKQKGQLSS